MRGKQNAKKEANGPAQIGLSGATPGVISGEVARAEGENGPARSGDDSSGGRCVLEGERRSTAGYVYLIGPLEGCHKIGCSIRPEKRLAALGNVPVEMSIVAAIPSDDQFWLERVLQAAFSHRRQRGEWFRLDESEVGLILGIPAATRESDLPSAILALRDKNRLQRAKRRAKERTRKLLTTSLSDRAIAALNRWCKRHGYRISDAIELGIATLPNQPPPAPEERRGRKPKGASK